MTVLLERLSPAPDEWTLTRDGDDWLLEAGEEHARLRDSRGLHYLRALLAAPGRDIPALDLAAGGAGLSGPGLGPVLDATARDAYRPRRRRRHRRARRRRPGGRPPGGGARGSRAAGAACRAPPGGRPWRPDREVAPEAERARVNVTRTLRAAIERVAAGARAPPRTCTRRSAPAVPAATTPPPAARAAGTCDRASRRMSRCARRRPAPRFPPGPAGGMLLLR